MAYTLSTVTFSDGKEHTCILHHSSGGSDKAHHAHQKEEAAFWGDFKRVTGGRYRALVAGNLVEALIETGGEG